MTDYVRADTLEYRKESWALVRENREKFFTQPFDFRFVIPAATYDRLVESVRRNHEVVLLRRPRDYNPETPEKRKELAAQILVYRDEVFEILAPARDMEDLPRVEKLPRDVDLGGATTDADHSEAE